MSTIIIDKALAEFDRLKAEATVFVAKFQAVAVTDAPTNMLAVEAAKEIKAHVALIKKKRLEYTAPLTAHIKETIAYEEKILAPLETRLRELSSQVVAYERGLEIERAKERQRLEAERIAAERRAEEEMQKVLDDAAAKAEYEKRHAQAAASMFGTDEPVVESPLLDVAAQEEIARLEREALARKAEHAQAAYDINASRTKGLRKVYEVVVLDLDAVPKEFLIRELNKAAALAVLKTGVKIAGLELREEMGLTLGRNTRVPDAALFGGGKP